MLAAARSRRAAAYRGDADAPRVEIVSEPALGASMDLPASDAAVWSALEETARALAERCDIYAIACNTLNVYAPRLEALDLPATLVSYPAAVARWVARRGIDQVGLLAARPVATLGEWSPYRSLADRIRVESPPEPDGLHDLIAAIKADGGADPAHGERLAALADGFESATLLLACTELPLVAGRVEDHELVDVTELVADELVRRWSATAAG